MDVSPEKSGDCARTRGSGEICSEGEHCPLCLQPTWNTNGKKRGQPEFASSVLLEWAHLVLALSVDI